MTPGGRASGARGGRFLGVVFAGGGSRRMGGDKALMPWPSAEGPVPLFRRAALVLEPLCERVEISVGCGAPRPELEGAGWATFPDAAVDAGPLAGLVAALERCDALDLDGVLALACDMPLVTSAELEPLLELLGPGADVAMWTVADEAGVPWDQPLVAAYGRAAVGPARAALDRGARRLVAIVDEVAANGRSLRVVRRPATVNSLPRLVNVNTPSDYDSAHASLSHPGLSPGQSPGGSPP